ncbi:hypothetical protein SLE2022_225820 [Rubroshorea leprosula]
MAAASPAPSNNSAEIPTAVATANAVAAAAAPSFLRMDTPPKSKRGLNKPKCIQCGNVARSRCPYRSCKSCCSKAQNPCHIHVIKANAAFPDKTPTSSIPPSDQKSAEASSAGTGVRVSVRQLSNAFAQFNNLQMSVRSKKHLTRKEAVAINEWRISKLKEFKDRNIEVENEAFDRYMQNVSLLEEVLSTKSIPEVSDGDGSTVSEPDPTSKESQTAVMISGLKTNLRSDPVTMENFRKRKQQLVDQGLKDLQQCEAKDDINDTTDQNKLDDMLKKAKTLWADRTAALDDLIDKLNKARNEDDLKSCLEIKAQLYDQRTVSSESETKDLDTSKEETAKDITPGKVADYSFPKLFTAIEIDHETLNNVDAHFSSLEQIEDL